RHREQIGEEGFVVDDQHPDRRAVGPGEGGLRHVPTLVCARLARALAPPWCSSAFPGDGGTRGAIGGHRIRAPLGDRGTGVEGPAEVLHASYGGQFLLAVGEVHDGSLPAGRGRGEPALALT